MTSIWMSGRPRAEKLEMTADEMREFLRTATWAQTAVNLQQNRSKPQAQQSIRRLHLRAILKTGLNR